MKIKMRLFLGIFFYCCLSGLIAQNRQLIQGDSLFNNKKYTEAYEKYELLYQNGQASSAMLLKMAVIKDGLGNYTEALFFLDQHYQISANRNVVGKIEELAKTHDLVGYNYDDSDYFLALLQKYRLHFLFLFSVSALLLLIFFVQKSKKGERPIATGIIQLILLVCLFFTINLKRPLEAIVTSDQSLLRAGPSAGSEPVERLKKGHKVKVLHKNGIWTKIMWEGNDGYIRNGKIKII